MPGWSNAQLYVDGEVVDKDSHKSAKVKNRSQSLETIVEGDKIQVGIEYTHKVWWTFYMLFWVNGEFRQMKKIPRRKKKSDK